MFATWPNEKIFFGKQILNFCKNVCSFARSLTLIHVGVHSTPLKVLFAAFLNDISYAGGYTTCGGTGVCRPVFRKPPTFMMNFGGKPPIFSHFWRFQPNRPMFIENLPKNDPCLENFGPKNPPIWAAHTRTINMLCTPPGFLP